MSEKDAKLQVTIWSAENATVYYITAKLANRLAHIRINVVAGSWFSLGFHVDFQKKYVDLHMMWWIITIGKDYCDYGMAESGRAVWQFSV